GATLCWPSAERRVACGSGPAETACAGTAPSSAGSETQPPSTTSGKPSTADGMQQKGAGLRATARRDIARSIPKRRASAPLRSVAVRRQIQIAGALARLADQTLARREDPLERLGVA